MNQKLSYHRIHRVFLTIALLSLVLSSLGNDGTLPVQAQDTTHRFTIKPGNYQILESLLTALDAKLGEITESSGGATSFGVGYYEEHLNWAWINLLVADGSYFDENEIGPSFLYFGVKNANGWDVAFSQNDQEYLSLLI